MQATSSTCELHSAPVLPKQELKQVLSGKKIVVIGFGINGFGDFLCAQKICLYLHETLGVDLDCLALASNAHEQQKKVFAIQNLTLLDETAASIQKWNPHLQIFAPVVDDDIVTPRLAMDNTVATVAIAEYGFDLPTYSFPHKNLSAHAFGFRSWQLGYIPTPKLRVWAAKKASSSPEERLKQLLDLPLPIQTAILGKQEALDSISTFATSNKLYFAYAKNNTEIYSFITAVARMNTTLQDKRNLTFFTLGSGLMSPTFIKSNLQGQASYHFENCFRMLKENGFSTINFVTPECPEASALYTLSPKHQKTITLICSPLTTHFVHHLMMASEEETLVTGDQSFSECLSAEKFPVYELFVHKRKLYEGFMALFPAEIASALQVQGPKKIASTSFQSLDIDKLTRLFILQQQDLQFAQSLKSSLFHIASAYDFSEKFDSILVSALKRSSTI